MILRYVSSRIKRAARMAKDPYARRLCNDRVTRDTDDGLQHVRATRTAIRWNSIFPFHKPFWTTDQDGRPFLWNGKGFYIKTDRHGPRSVYGGGVMNEDTDKDEGNG